MGAQILTTSFHRRTNKTKNRPKPTKEKHPFSKKTKNEVKKSNLVNGQVTLLRRGESLSSIKSKEPIFNPIDVNKPVKNPVFSSIDVKTPVFSSIDVNKPVKSPVFVPNRIFLPPVWDMFAGSSVVTSPSPRKVPHPSFIMGRDEKEEDEVTNNLRRMLRLDEFNCEL